MHGLLWSSFIFFLAAVAAVPVSKKLGFGSVLGYLIAGFLIGPSGFRLITNVEDILHFSEFGVVLLLFIIGLELELKKLWQMRISIFGLGGAQVLLGVAAFSLAARLFGLSWPASILVGMAFSLSSTAMALQTLGERKLLATGGGRSAFSVLLFQDIAVIPMLALLPLLAGGKEESAGFLSALLGFAKVVGVLLVVFVLGRLFLNRAFRVVANARLRELFTALALLLVVGMGLLMESLQLSMGLGAFIAGLLLADSEFKHAIEADIEPFKGLLLGLFFISVGMTVKGSDLLGQPLLVAGAVLATLMIKLGIHTGLGYAFRVPRPQVPFFSLVLAQVGEFAFVLFGAALGLGIVSEEERGVLVAVSALSFVAVSLAVKVYDLLLAPRLEGGASLPPDEIASDGSPVIIAGFGRVGQIVGRFLFANGIKATVLDFEAEQVESLRRFGFKVFYGDATREDLLTAAGAREHFPHLKLVCRARNVAHVFELRARGVEILERETFDGALRLGRKVLEHFGTPPYQAHTLGQKFRELDHDLMEGLVKERGNERSRISLAQQARLDIERLFAEEDNRIRHGDEGWR